MGRLGVAIDTAADMGELFDGIPLEQASVSLTINHPAIVLLAMFLHAAERRGIPWPALRGTVQNDSLKEFHGQKTFALPPAPALKLTTDVIEFATQYAPNWYTVSISGYHTREAGADAVQELAFTIAQGMAYVESARERGLPVDAFAPRLSHFFGVHNDFFEEIAKFRAARQDVGAGYARPLRGQPPGGDADALSRPNPGVDPGAARPAEQHPAGRIAGAGGGAGRRAVAAHQRL